MKKTLFMLFCLLCSIGAMAQKKTITGVVTDATGEAVIGASIVETGTTNGTVTDLDGNFTLSVANDGSIRVSFVGYQTQTLSVKGKSTFKIALKEDSEMLQEVVVTGYGGKQLRTKVTNSISKVKEETLNKDFIPIRHKPYQEPWQVCPSARLPVIREQLLPWYFEEVLILTVQVHL